MGEEIDIEALQAQIDLSNSIAYDLVSSWMKPSSKKDTEYVSKSIARDLEEHAKRPPRLGLGASASKSSVATSREAARLKGKLIGAKRARQEGGESTSTHAAGDVQDDEDEDESRSAAISTKKLRTNGVGALSFGIGNGSKGKDKTSSPNEPGKEAAAEESRDGTRKKRKKKHEEGQDAGTSKVGSTPSKRNPFVVSSTPFSNISTIDLTSPSPSPARLAASAENSTPLRKNKKKHKKKHKDTGKDGNTTPIEDEEWHGFSDEFLELSDEEPPGLDHQALPSMAASPSPLITPKPHFSSPSSIIDLTSPIRPTSSPSRVPLAKPPTREAIPLLNLQAPPPSDTDEARQNENGMVNESPKRKRPKRRRGRGRKSQSGDTGEQA